MNEIKLILEEIVNNKKIIILRHVLPDGDAYGFQFGLKRLIDLNWPGKDVKISGKPNNDLDYIAKGFDNISDIEFSKSLVIVGDTANTARIDDERWIKGKKIIKIDHHPNREPYGDIMYVRDDFCSVCEVLTEIILDNNLKIDKEIAKLLYHGIVTDSDRFLVRFPKPRTLKLAAFLLEQNFNLEKLYKEMYSKTSDELNFIAYVYNNFKISDAGVAYLFLNKKILSKLKISADKAAYDYVKLLGNIKGSSISAFFCEYQNGEIRCELRSDGLIINEVAEKFGGGGHRTSAGIKIFDFNKATEIIDCLDKVIIENN